MCVAFLWCVLGGGGGPVKVDFDVQNIIYYKVLLPRKTLSKYLMYGNPPVKYNPAQLATADAASSSGPNRY